MKIVLSGGNFVNKGAEAMLFIAANECFQRFEAAECILQLPEGFITVKSIDELHSISIGEISVRDLNKPESKMSKIKDLIDFYKSADIMLDLSGYELSSKLGIYPSMRYLFKIIVAKHTKTKVYLMPQSFGPFEYRGIKGAILKVLIRHYLKYPEICFAREKEGYELLKRACPNANVRISNDLVLENKNIWHIKEKYGRPEIEINKNSVGLIPNKRLIEQCSESAAMKCFCSAVRKIRALNRSVYLLCHSSDDMEICKRIKEYFKEDDYVVVIPTILSCFTYQTLSAEFLYVVAARYHSIVHAYKEATPAVALGWATKYAELLSRLGQEPYLVEIDNDAADAVEKAIDQMDKNYERERKIIECRMKTVQEKCCFDFIEED